MSEPAWLERNFTPSSTGPLSAADGVTGTAEAKPPASFCASCVGKYFVAKGGSAPSSVDASQQVREEDLPKTVRIVRPDDGIADLQANPNRLTIVIGEDGRIVDAAWE